jgi:hypothetical protein
MSLLRNLEEKKLTEKEQADAEKDFFKNVVDPVRFGDDTDLSEGGKRMVSATYQFHPEHFATVHFSFRDINPNGFGHRYSVLYRKTGKEWKPVGVMGGPRE